MRLPYPGLRPFRRDESDLFFGREGSVDDLVDKLAATRFLAVLGTSGSGKSSLIRTGLLDGLELGLSPNMGASWRIADFRPGDKPITNLSKALLGVDTGDQLPQNQVEVDLLADYLARGPRSLSTWCSDGNLAESMNLLLLVDQFEELFRFDEYAGREEAEAFVSLLLQSSSEPGSCIYVVITMRSEFLGACSLMPGLAERINEGLYLTPRMEREQCRQAIAGPASVTGFALEPALVNRLLNDLSSFAPWEESAGTNQLQRISRRADQLPLMQHVLNRLWLRSGKAGQTVCLTLQAYEGIGGLSGALDEHGAEIMQRLGNGRRPQIEAVFRCLVAGNGLTSAVRRPVRFAELVVACGGDEESARQIVDEFRSETCNFLQPPTSIPLEPATMVDITHESLIRQWRELSAWLLAEAKAADQWQHLALSAQSHSAGQGDLLHGLALSNAFAWWTQENPTPEWTSRYGGQFKDTSDFLKASQTQAKGVVKNRRTLRFALISLSTLLVGAIVVNLVQTQSANSKLEEQAKKLEVTNGKLVEQKKDLEANLVELKAEKDKVAKVNDAFVKVKIDIDEKNLALDAKNTELDSANRTTQFRNAELTKLNQRLKPYLEVIEVVEALKNKQFARNSKISSDDTGIALGGYDPVSFFRASGPAIGKLDYFTLQQGAIWLFDSRESKQVFDKNPNKYTPAFGGFCTPCLVQKHVVHARPDSWFVHEGRLYLASNKDLIDDFKQNLASYVVAAQSHYSNQTVAWDSSPNIRTAAGQQIASHALLLDTPDAYLIQRAAARDYAQSKRWYAAATQQQGVVERMLKLPIGNEHRTELPSEYLSLARYLMHTGKDEFAGAERAVKAGLQLQPQSLELKAALANALFLQGNTESAISIYRQHLGQLIPGKYTWEEEVAEGLDLLKTTNADVPKAAEFSAARSIVETPANYPWLKSKAAEFQEKKDWPKAVSMQQAVVDYLNKLDAKKTRRDDLPTAYTYLAYYQFFAKDFSAALATSSEGRKIKPSDSVLKILAANALLLSERWEDAMVIYDEDRGIAADDKSGWEANVISQLNTLEFYGVTHRRFAEVRSLMQTGSEFAKLKSMAYGLRQNAKWPEAIAARRKAVEFLLALPPVEKLRSRLPEEYSLLSWYQSLGKDFAGALNSSAEGLALEPQSMELAVNRAHALLLSNQVAEAEKLYMGNRGKMVQNGTTWDATILEDLDKLEKAGITHREFARLRAMMQGK
jgi:hypothetical protein